MRFTFVLKDNRWYIDRKNRRNKLLSSYAPEMEAIDCFDGLAVSWTIGTSPDAGLVNTMLDNAIGTLKENDHPIIHSDLGAHYRWSGWIERMENAGRTRIYTLVLGKED